MRTEVIKAVCSPEFAREIESVQFQLQQSAGKPETIVSKNQLACYTSFFHLLQHGLSDQEQKGITKVIQSLRSILEYVETNAKLNVNLTYQRAVNHAFTTIVSEMLIYNKVTVSLLDQVRKEITTNLSAHPDLCTVDKVRSVFHDVITAIIYKSNSNDKNDESIANYKRCVTALNHFFNEPSSNGYKLYITNYAQLKTLTSASSKQLLK
jgi:signal recognition particle GTPase